MIRSVILAAMPVIALAFLPACSFAEVRETVHKSVPVGGSPTIKISNSVGGVTVRAWDKPVVDIVAEKDAHSTDALQKIDINVQSHDGTVTITTVNNNGGGFWQSGGVGYTVMVPARSSLDVQNTTGGVRIFGISGNVVARVTTGGVRADLGRITGNRSVDMSVVTGGIDLTMAKNSDATVDMHTTVGGIKSDFAGNRIGSGTAKIHLVTTTGGVSLHAS